MSAQREWKPGDVAMVRSSCCGEAVAMHTTDGEWGGPGGTHTGNEVWTARPLVVIDPEDREQVNRLADAFCSARWSHIPGSDDECDPLTRSSMESALRSLIEPPKPEEPTGLGALIEADGDIWSRNAAGVWLNLDGGSSYCEWCNFDHVKVLSEGVTQ